MNRQDSYKESEVGDIPIQKQVKMGNEGSSLAQRNFEAREDESSVMHNMEINNIQRDRVRLCYCQQAQHHLARSHTVFNCMITALIGLLQVEYQTKGLSPFDTHPVNMWVFFAASCTVGLGLSIEHQFQNQFINGVMISSSVLSLISLASIFLPRLLGWICLGLWIVLPIVLARHSIKQIYDWLKRDIKEKSSLACNKFKRFWEYLTGMNQHLPQ